MITFLSGSMFGGKSKTLIDIITRSATLPYHVLKPEIDTRDGLFIKSRDYGIKIPASPWSKYHNDEVSLQKKIGSMRDKGFLFIDEAHFIGLEHIQFITNLCIAYNVHLVVAGLETDFRQEWFPSTKWLKGKADEYIFFHGKCRTCGQLKAEYNIRYDSNGKRITEGESIEVGDSGLYDVLCERCLHL